MSTKGQTAASSQVSSPISTANQRLESWKDIAAYLKRDVSTVQRWEKKEGLPVHRHMHDRLGSVYAFTGELDTWREQKRWAKDESRAQSARFLHADESHEPETGLTTTAADPSASGRRNVRSRVWAATAAAVVILLAAAVFWGTGAPDRATPLEVKHTQISYTGEVHYAALSPDGQTVAYVTGEDDRDLRLLVRDIRGGESLELWHGSTVRDLEWLRDGSQLVVSGRFGTWLVPRLGGTVRQLDAGGGYIGVSPDGTHLALARAGQSAGFSILSIHDGSGRTVPLAGFPIINGLEWNVPTNKIVIGTATPDGEWVVWSVSPNGQDLRRIHTEKGIVHSACSSSVDDALYFFTGQRLRRVSLTDVVPARPEPLLSGLPAPAPGIAAPRPCNVTASGRQLLHMRPLSDVNLWRLDLGTGDPRATPLTRGTASYTNPIISPDGQWTVFSNELSAEITKMALAGGKPIPLFKNAEFPVLSRDGERLAFVSSRSGVPRVWVSKSDGRDAVEVTDSAVSAVYFLTWLPDGRVAWQTPDYRNYQIRDLSNGRDEYLMAGPSLGAVFNPRFSPAGDRFVVYWQRPDQRGLWMFAWPGRDAKLLAPGRLVPDGWSPDGEWIYAHEIGSTSIVRISTRSGDVRSVGSFPTGSLGMEACNVSPSGQAIVCGVLEMKSDAWLIENFDPNVSAARTLAAH